MSKTKRHLRNSAYLVLGALLGAFSINLIYTPLKLTMGGVSGVASIIFQLTGQGEFLPFGVLVILLNIPLLILGWFKVGRSFVVKSIIGTIVYSLAIDLLAPLTSDWFEKYIDLPLDKGFADPLIYCIFGGIIYGIAVGLIIRAGYTTGGTDILGIIIFRKLRVISIGKILLIIDLIIVLSTVYFYRESKVTLVLYSLVAMYLTSHAMDIAIDGFNNKRTVFIIAEKKKEIADFVLLTLERGATEIHATGAHSGQPRNVLMVVLAHRQVPVLQDFIEQIDKQAFIVVSDSREVMGLGFERDIAEYL